MESSDASKDYRKVRLNQCSQCDGERGHQGPHYAVLDPARIVVTYKGAEIQNVFELCRGIPGVGTCRLPAGHEGSHWDEEGPWGVTEVREEWH